MAPQDNDVRSDCSMCKAKVSEAALVCSKCKHNVHLRCSNLPMYQLVNLLNSRIFYTCEACVKLKFVSEYDEKVKFYGEKIKSEAFSSASGVSNETAAVLTGGGAQDVDGDVIVMDVGEAASAPGLSQLSCHDSVSQLGLEGDEEPSQLNGEGPRRPQDDQRSTKVCYFYRRRACKFGKSGRECKYRHPNLCFKFKLYGNDKNKGCPSNKYNSLHPIMCRNLKTKGECLAKKCDFFHPKYMQQAFPKVVVDSRSDDGSRPSKTDNVNDNGIDNSGKSFLYSDCAGSHSPKKHHFIDNETRNLSGTKFLYSDIAAGKWQQNEPSMSANAPFLGQVSRDFQTLKQQVQQLADLVQTKLLTVPTWLMNQPNLHWPHHPHPVRLV